MAILIIALNSCKTTTQDASELTFYGADNQSAQMTFESEIEFDLPDGVTREDDLWKPKNKSKIYSLIDWQVKHIYGAFSYHDAFVKNPGIIEGRGQTYIQFTEINLSKKRGLIGYTHKDKVVFKKRVLSGNKPTVKFFLPRDPAAIYSKGIRKRGGANYCTDEHYNSEDDFWYFWNPRQEGCPISKDDLIEITGYLKPIPNTEKTYPYYDKLLGDNGNGKTVKITYLIGVDESFKAGDLGSGTFREAFDLLRASNFKVQSSIRRRSILTYKTADYDVEVDMRLVDPKSDQFVAAAADGMENSDIFIYDGHSGLGGYLYVERFEETLGRPLRLKKDKNQIFYFNGCSTFAYYNADYFDLKSTENDAPGRKNLDVITTTIGATFDIGARHDVAVITSLVDGSRPSWQTIMDRVYKADKSQTALTHVNGDEDNPSSPGNVR